MELFLTLYFEYMIDEYCYKLMTNECSVQPSISDQMKDLAVAVEDERERAIQVSAKKMTPIYIRGLFESYT